MRITNQMLARTSARTGIALQQNSLLDIMNKRSPGALPSAGGAGKTNAYLQSYKKKEARQLKASAEDVNDLTQQLRKDGADSVFAEAEASGDTSDLTGKITEFADAYNKTIKYLKSSDSVWNKLYLQEMQSNASQYAAALRAAGVTPNRDGSLSVQKDRLQSADVNTLKAAFGSGSGFVERAGFISGRAAANANTPDAYRSGSYTGSGTELWNSFLKNRYNVWG